MATNLYETLDISRDATPEEIRKAYKRKALQTHPDRLPPTATAAEKRDSEEQFRRVNNAYEILNDPQNRKIYDHYGVFPPPEYERAGTSSHHSRHKRHTPQRTEPLRDPFSDPFFSQDFHDFTFTDPFELFDRMFADIGGRGFWRESPASRFPSRFDGLFAELERDMFSDFGFPRRSLLPPGFGMFPAITGPSGEGRSYASEGFYSQTINGVTHTVHKRRDWDGTTHEIRTYPDGRKVHMIDGVEQSNPPDSRYLPPSNPNHPTIAPPPKSPPTRGSMSHHQNYLPPPPSYHSTSPVVPQETHHKNRHHSQTTNYNQGSVYPYQNEKPHHWWSPWSRH